MCPPVIGAVGGALGLGAGFGLAADQAHRQRREARRAQREQERQARELAAQRTEDEATQADAAYGLSVRDKRRALARSMAGTIFTSPLGTQTQAYGKRTLLGE